MAKRLVSFLVILVLCFSFVVPVGMAEGTEGGGEAPVILEPTAEPEPEPEAPRTPAPSPEPEAPEPGEGTPEEPEPAAPEAPSSEPEEPGAPGEPEATPEELSLAAVALLPQNPDAVEAVTEELEEQLRVVTEQLYALLTQEQLDALAGEIGGESEGEGEASSPADALSDALRAAALLVLRLNARITELNAQAAQAVRDLIAALPAAETMTVEYEAQVTEAVAAYEALTATQKALLTQEETAALAAAQALMAELLAKAQAALVDGMIALLPDVSEITVENYEEYEAPAQEAADALLALSDYERSFVRGANLLEAILRSLEAKKSIADILLAIYNFLTAGEPGDALTFKDGATSVAKALALETAYGELSAAERSDTILALAWSIFAPYLTMAHDLDYIREHGRISIQHPSLTIPEGQEADIPEYYWEELWGTELEFRHPLVLEFPEATHITRDGDKIHAVAETVEDAQILVYGEGALALKDLAVPIAVTVVPPPVKPGDFSAGDIDPKAFTDIDAYTFNRACIEDGLGDEFWPRVTFSIGKHKVTNLIEYTAAVSITGNNPGCLRAGLNDGDTYVQYFPNLPGGTKNGTYKIKLKYDITLPGAGGGTVSVLTNDIKIVVTDKPAKIAFKPPVVNLFYETREGEFIDGDSCYPAVWLTQTQDTDDWGMSLAVVEEDRAKYPVMIDFDAVEGRYRLMIRDKVRFAKSTTWKVRFLVSGGMLRADQSYVITVPISMKRVAPPLSLAPKAVSVRSVNDAFQVSLCSKTGSPLNGLKIDLVCLPFNSEKYPYQELFKQPVRVSTDEYRWVYEMKSKAAITVPLPSSFKLLVRVVFAGTDSQVDLPLTVSVVRNKITLVPSSCALNWTAEVPQAGAVIRFKTNDGSLPVLNAGAGTVDGIPFGDPACPLLVSPEPGMAMLYNQDSALPDRTYKVVLAFEDGQAVKLNVSTKQAQNRIMLGQTAFTTDRASPEDTVKIPYNLTYYLSYFTHAPEMEMKVGKEWVTPFWMTSSITEAMNLEVKGIAKLGPGKHTFRLYHPANGIPKEKATTFTVTVKEAALKFTATMTSPYIEVLGTGDVLAFTNPKVTGLMDAGCMKNLDGWPPKWTVTVGGAGAQYMELAWADSEYIGLAWKGAGTYAMRQNGLKPFKLTLQLRDNATKTLLAESKPFTVKPVQKPVVKLVFEEESRPWLTLYSNMIYQRDALHLDVRKYYEDGETYSEEVVQWVALKDAGKSSYRVYFMGNEEWGGSEECALVELGYKDAAAAKKAKAGETVTLLVMLKCAVTPIEIKVPVKNFK